VRLAGFEELRWGREIDVFSGSKHESDAKEFETRGITIAALKPRKEHPVMASLNELLQMDGVMAVGQFAPDGRLIEYKANGDMPQDLAAMSAQFCATVSMLFGTMAGAFTQMSGMSWTPPQGWMYAGGDWTVAVGGNTGVFVETAKADFNKLYGALTGGR
jgi:roadblock/LC7 domain-containing protein